VRLAVKAELVRREPPAILVRPHMSQEMTWIQRRNLSQEELVHFRQEKAGGVEEMVLSTRVSLFFHLVRSQRIRKLARSLANTYQNPGYQ